MYIILTTRQAALPIYTKNFRLTGIFERKAWYRHEQNTLRFSL